MTTNEPDLPPLPPKWSDPGYLAREAERGRIGRARRALRAFIEHLDAAPSAAVLDALNSALLAYDPPPNEPPGDDLRAALKVVADGRAYTREHFSRPPTGYVGHTPAAEYDAAVDAIVDGLTDILDSTPPRPSPPTDLRDAVAAVIERHEVVWVDHDTGWECGCNEHGDCALMPTRADAVHHIADAVLPAVQAHVTAEVERARAEALRDLRTWAEEQGKAWETPFPNDWDAAHLHVRSGRQSAYRSVVKELDRVAAGGGH